MKRILLIEDDTTTRELLIRLLSGAHKCFHGEVKVEQAQSWEDGAKWIEQGGVDIVLLDLTLPPHTRDETSIKLSAVASVWPPIIVITGHEEDEMRRRCIGFGAADYMLKECAMKSPPDSIMERCYNAYLKNRYGQRASL